MTDLLILGIVQGRLSPAPAGKLQWFPQEVWREEFRLAKESGYRYIELIAEREHNENNPIWSASGIEEIKQLIDQNGLIGYAFCDDYIINHSLLKDPSAVNLTFRLLEQGKKLGIKKLVYPLFEKSELNENNGYDYQPMLRDIADAAEGNDIVLCLETIVNGQVLLKFLEAFDHKNIKCVFDTGNRIAFGHDIYSDIKLLNEHIEHVHIKDKNDTDENVFLGTGKVNFFQVFKSLREINYQGFFTFETVRGSDPQRTARYNRDFITYFYQESSADGY